MENKSKPRANTAFLKGMRYSLSFFLIVLSCLYFFMVGLRAEEPIILINLLLGCAGIVFTAFFISFLVCYVGTKRGIEAGESADDKIFTRDGKLNINIFKKPLD